MAERDEEPGADDRFLRAMYPSLVRSVACVVDDTPTAEDLVQESMARYLARPRRRVIVSPEAYLYTIAMNMARSWLRRRSLERRVAPRLVELHDDPSSPSGLIEGVDLREAVRRLPARQREAIALRFLADLDVAQTASVMRCAEGTVRALTTQGVVRLRRELGDYAREGER